jgi:uncharacterized membrane protein
MTSELLKPLMLALTTPIGIVLGWLGITVAEDELQVVLVGLATLLGFIGTVWGPSISALLKFKRDAK